MLEQMTARQLGEWEAMFAIWNMGDYPSYRGDLAAGQISAMIHNANRRTGGKPLKPTDFLFTFERVEADENESAETSRDRMLAYAKQNPRRRKKTSDSKRRKRK